jgi:hypothetical protein
VLEKDTYNGTILGKFFRKDLEWSTSDIKFVWWTT